MAQISMDEARTQIWIDDVNAEIESVRVLLKKVSAANSEVVGSEDTIMENIVSYATNVDAAWTKVCNAFEDAQQRVRESVVKVVKSAESVIDDVNALKSRV